MNILNDEIFYNDDGGMGKYIVNKLQLPPAQADPETVKKYDGKFEYEQEKNVFSVYAMMYER